MPDLRGRDQFERVIAREFKAVGDKFADELVRALGDPPNPDNIPASFWRRYGLALQRKIQPTLEQIYIVAAGQVLTEAALGVSWMLPNEAAAAWAEKYAFELVRQINQTTVTKLQGYVSDYFRTQKTMGQLRAEIQPNIDDLITRSGRLLTSAQRAQLIATTEVTRASVQGELAIVSKIETAGFEMVTIWATNNDDMVCPMCGPRNEKAQGDGWDSPPPAHPRCRCWVNHTLASLVGK
jgi:hypothetical protein